MNKKTLATITASYSLVAILLLGVLALNNDNNKSIVHTTAGNESYSMVFNENSQKIYNLYGPSGTETGSITNERGNEFQFMFDQVYGDVAGWWQAMNDEGYIRNVTPICGITSIEITTSNKVAFDIYYGASYDDVNNNHIYIEEGTTNHTYDFSAYMPNFFKITRYDHGPTLLPIVAFVEVIINYSCTPTSCYVNATSSNETYGTVSGGGTHTIGEEVTLTATAANDTENKVHGTFEGWYDGETLLSNNASYTFTPTVDSLVYNYEAKFVEANSEEFTIATKLYRKTLSVYDDYEEVNDISFLKSYDGTYFALISYQNSMSDNQTFAQNQVFISYGHGTSSATYDLWFNRSDVYDETYALDAEGTQPVTLKYFDYSIACVDFYFDVSSSGYIGGNDLSTTRGALGKYDSVDGKYSRLSLVGYTSGSTKSFAIEVPDTLTTSQDMIIKKVVVYYK